jgi:hypothetical protein
MESRTFTPIASFSASLKAFSCWIAHFSQFFDSLRNPLSIVGCACSHGQFARSPPRATALWSRLATLCGVRVPAETRRSKGAPHARTTRRPTRFDPDAGLPWNNHGFADRTACCPKTVEDHTNTRPKMRPEQDQGGSVHGRIAGGRIVVVRRRQSPKRRRASWQASSPGKHTRQTCGLSA